MSVAFRNAIGLCTSLWRTWMVIHKFSHSGDNYSVVIEPRAVDRGDQRQRVVIRKPTKAMANPMRMFHAFNPGIGYWLPLT